MGSLKAKLSRAIGTAITDYGMIAAGDTVAVAVSGGKDSLTLLDILMSIRRRSGVRFDLVAVTVDQGYEGFRWPVMERHFRELGVPYHIENTHIRDTIEDHKSPGSTWCSLCARLRRGVLYRLAREKGWSSIALGHHADDLIETLMLSQLFNGAMQSMPPILKAQDGINTVIRPMSYVWERQVIAYTEERRFPVICCACPACRDFTLKRQRVKAMLQELEEAWPGVKRSLLGAQRNLKLSQLMDPRFLPLGREARLRAEAEASPLFGLARETGEDVDPDTIGAGGNGIGAGTPGNGEGAGPEPLLTIARPRSAGEAMEAVGSSRTGQSRDMARSGAGGTHLETPGDGFRPIPSAPRPALVHESAGSCGSMCGCGPLA